MLHPRYGNYLSCLFHTFKEEGPKGLYRGYPPHMLATAITFALIPILADSILQSSPLMRSGSKYDRAEKNDALYDDVVEGRERVEQVRAAQKKQREASGQAGSNDKK